MSKTIYDKHDYLIITFFVWFRLGFWISCIYWTETRDFCTRQIFKGFLDFLTGMRVFCICWTFKGCQIFCTN
ncbi:hypothetical protein RIR_jg5069.t1 [Rhizophagus irregularis DAOM 181602=DAOM 197198]|nr:hypothetical protein RIR_jg5069.t1 [Rhizophagus irregularis DAOM 181602=DAOM 197198]